MIILFVHKENKNNDFIQQLFSFASVFDVTWTILMMALLPFWVLNMVVALLFMKGQRALISSKNILICVPKMNEGLMGLERHEGE